MWLIEFVDGHLHGVSIPLQNTFCLTGNKEVTKENQLSVPEYLPSNAGLDFAVENQVCIVKGLLRGDKPKKLVANRIYTFKGLRFFLFQEGNRSPRLRRLRSIQYAPILALSLLLNIGLVYGGFTFLQSQQQASLGGYLKQLNTGFIKDGKLHIFDKSILQQLPDYWRDNLQLIESDQYLRTTQFDIDLVSSYSGKHIKGKLVAQEDRDKIYIDTYEEDNQIMRLFGERGLMFSQQNGYWFVSDYAEAAQTLNRAGLGSLVKQLRSNDTRSENIPTSEFPYSIFYSTTSGRYIYDQQGRYWEGSTVPHLGVIQSISRDKVIFKDNQNTRVYFINR
ncbi:hypothetical protein BS333_08485 [Vibrio azureus]|uniref:Uncharacterized protein n=1 Tax=Vibrio azureus NBRC 104587 TaxID=1219077 RepID=U3C1P6_9VIBR|nr:hypothetical protein [Vibrio azureus]AUI86421.1 hypothetical protein BS333_08485 [Vibrio azureus]GAD75399.1 hypothetical protein VAZ01S_024_00830 [Vibrio azureus NBRC 104587]